MRICRGIGAFGCTVSFLLIFQLLTGSDFWISSAWGRWAGCPVGSTPPDPDEVVWLPYRSFCVGVQTMSSLPSWLIIDDYPEEDIPDCAEIKSARYMDFLRNQSPGCRVEAVTDVTVNIIDQHDLICNGNVSGGYYVSNILESYVQEFEVECDSDSPTRIVNTIGSKYYVREPVGPNEVVREKNRGLPRCGLSAGNPINIATGNKYHQTKDTTLPGGLKIVRHYNSNDSALRSFGAGWRGSFSRRIKHVRSTASGDVAIAVVRDDGAENFWHLEGGILLAPPDAAGRLEISYSNGIILGYTYIPNDSSIETYDARGRLQSIEDDRGQALYFSYTGALLEVVATATGRALTYTHTPEGRVGQISNSGGASWKYDYDAIGNLLQVEHPDGSTRVYHYENPDYPHALTGESDERGHRIRSWVYDASGRAILSTQGEPDSLVERTEINYNEDGSTTTVDALQKAATHRFENAHGIAKSGSASELCESCSGRTKTTTYDSRGNKDIVTDFNGNTSDFDYTTDNFLQKVTHAVGTASEWAVTYQWDPFIRKPVEIMRPGQTVTFSYNHRGQLLSRRQTDTDSRISRSWAYSYFEPPAPAPLIGNIRSINGPRTDVNDVTTFEYYTSDHPDGDFLTGDLRAIVNAMGHRIEYLKYDGDGRPVEIRDANGILTSLSYHARGWLQSRTIDVNTTLFAYDAAGNPVRVTQPDGSFTAYEYDEMSRLTAVADNFNNRVEYGLDSAGNRISENTFDQNGVLRHQLSRVYNELNQLKSMIDGNNDQTQHRYDANGNLTGLQGPALNLATFEFDPLNRLVKTIDAMSGETLMEYDARNNLVSVTDSLGNPSIFGYDGFNAKIRSDSPDSGIIVQEYDEAGNRTARVDARGVRSEYTYDALNRLTAIQYPDSGLDVSFTHDTGLNGLGRLTRMSDAAGEVRFSYDARGNLIQETRSTGSDSYSTGYAYSDADRLIRITYPSGMIVDFTRDEAGRIVAIDKSDDSGTETLARDIQYAPFGPVTGFTYGNGLSYSADFDRDYQLDRLQSGPGIDWLMAYDATGNLLSITDQTNGQNSQAFGYDSVHRLISAQGAYGSEAFEYDSNGNRWRFASDAVDETYGYEPFANRLEAQGPWTFERDAAGNRSTKKEGRRTLQSFSYGDHNRMQQASIRGSDGETVVAKYTYDGHGRRASKTSGGTTIHFIYGPSGELLGEYTTGSTELFIEYVYLDGQAIAVTERKTEVFQPPGAVLIVDNGDPGTSGYGSWQTKSNRKDYGTDYLFANKAANQSYRWSTTAPGLMYDVYAWWVAGKSYSGQVAYTIGYGAGQTDTVSKSQKSGGGQWQFLGSYHRSDGLDFVEARSADNKWVADAIRWEEIRQPVVTVTASTHFIHNDHLGTPREVTDDAQETVWTWYSRPFGNSPPNEDPDGDFTNFTLNLRFPGQYHDTESGLHYNYFRTYDPGTGRYLESDPIGLEGGMNVFTYVENSPVQFIDPRGLKVTGEWIKEPILNVTDYGVTGVNMVTPYLDEWGYLKAFRLYGYATAYVNLDILCTDTEACDKLEWEIHEQIDVSYRGYKDVGPNTAAVGAGLVFGPLAGVVSSIVTFGGSTLTGLLEFLNEVDARGGDKIHWLHQLGPALICRGTR